MIIRPLTKLDIESAGNVVAKSYAVPPWSETWTLQEGIDSVNDFTSDPRCIPFVGVLDDKIIAVLLGHTERYRDTHYYINHLCVLPDEHNKGYGTQMLNHTINELKSRGIVHCELMCQPSAIGYYERVAFAVNPHASMFLEINQ